MHQSKQYTVKQSKSSAYCDVVMMRDCVTFYLFKQITMKM